MAARPVAWSSSVLDPRGYVLHESEAQGPELDACRHASICVYWGALDRQVRIEGDVTLLPDDEADRYFATRPRDSQIGAWASRQSERLPDQATLMARVAVIAAKYIGRPVPRPPFWSGFRLVPHRISSGPPVWAACTSGALIDPATPRDRSGEEWIESWLFP